jgi:hypothetical protein
MLADSGPITVPAGKVRAMHFGGTNTDVYCRFVKASKSKVRASLVETLRNAAPQGQSVQQSPLPRPSEPRLLPSAASRTALVCRVGGRFPRFGAEGPQNPCQHPVQGSRARPDHGLRPFIWPMSAQIPREGSGNAHDIRRARADRSCMSTGSDEARPGTDHRRVVQSGRGPATAFFIRVGFPLPEQSKS